MHAFRVLKTNDAAAAVAILLGVAAIFALLHRSGQAALRDVHADEVWYYLHVPKASGTAFGNALANLRPRTRYAKGVCRGFNLMGYGYQRSLPGRRGFGSDSGCLSAVTRWMAQKTSHGAARRGARWATPGRRRSTARKRGDDATDTLGAGGLSAAEAAAAAESSWCRIYSSQRMCYSQHPSRCSLLWAEHYGANVLRLARARRPRLRAFTMLRHPVDQFYSFWRFLRYCASYDVEGMQAPPPNRSYDPRWSGSPLSLHEAVRHEARHCPALLPSCHSATFRALTLLAGRSGTCGDPLSGEGGLPRDLGGVNTTSAEAVLLREATEAARTFDVIGFAEDIGSSLALLAHATGAPPADVRAMRKAVGRRVNPCGGFVPLREDLPTPETDETLRRLLAPDIALYESLRAEFAQRLRAAGIHAEGGKARGRG